jgi:hypothetical protein
VHREELVMTTLDQPLAGKRLKIFLSYARVDQPALQAVQEGLEALHHQLWIDRKLDGGQDWWNEILAQIRSCDAIIVAVSTALLESDAAEKEREYARRLGKPGLRRGDTFGSARASRLAKIWGIAGVCVGAIVIIVIAAAASGGGGTGA